MDSKEIVELRYYNSDENRLEMVKLIASLNLCEWNIDDNPKRRQLCMVSKTKIAHEDIVGIPYFLLRHSIVPVAITFLYTAQEAEEAVKNHDAGLSKQA